MHVDQHIRKLYGSDSKHTQLKAVEHLQKHLDDPVVLPALCLSALKSNDGELRARIVEALEPIHQDASRIFNMISETGASPAIRKRAYSSLSLMGRSS